MLFRQTVSKWENGQAVPELNGLILLSELYGVTIDRIVKENDGCNIPLCQNMSVDINKMISFLLCAKKNTYAATDNQTTSSRINSHNFRYEDNSGYVYYDSYLGGECFAGEEAVWPFRGPEIYTKGDYRYHCKVDGEFVWFQGYEEIFYMNEKIYECYFHGGVIR